MGLQTAVQTWPRLPLRFKSDRRILLLLPIAFIFAISTLHSPWQLTEYAYRGSGRTGQKSIPKLPHIQKLCHETQWTDGLSLWCHSACGTNRRSMCGGLTNARSRLQTCIRWAMDAGASELIVPHVVGRLGDNQVDWAGAVTCSDEWFDMAQLGATLEANCPRLKIRVCPSDGDDEDGSEATPTVRRGRSWNELDFPGSYKGSFRELVVSSLKEEGFDIASVSPENPVVLDYADAYLGWNYSASGELGTVQKELLGAINYHPDLLSMGAGLARNPRLRNGEFIAVHFRGESDWPDEWGSREDQTRLYTEYLEEIRQNEIESHLRDVYVSCGDKEAIERFRQHLRPRGFRVHDKSSLLEDDHELRDRIEALDFDRRAVVDYGLLLGAKYFMGVFASSFSMFVADARSIGDKDDQTSFLVNVLKNSHVDHSSGLPLLMWDKSPALQGSKYTKLMVKSERLSMMSIFP